SPSLMMIFEGGDLNCAMHHLVCSLQNPFEMNSVATLLIQESVRESFVNCVREQIQPLDAQLANHPRFVRTQAKLEELKAETIGGDPKTVPTNATPLLVCDLTHSFLGNGPTGVITMHTFRTPKEATQVNKKETLKYSSVSIWNEKLASAYEICELFDCSVFMLNCFNVDLNPILPAFEANQNDVKIFKGYHYETLMTNHKRKIIVFPVGTIFAN
ncbi:CG15717, partial [Drosophila busckii]